MTWGVEDDVMERFGAAGVPADRSPATAPTGTSTSTGRRRSCSPIFGGYYGPTMNAFAAAAADGREAELQAELEALFEAQNEAAQGTSITATFLLVNVSRP